MSSHLSPRRSPGLPAALVLFSILAFGPAAAQVTRTAPGPAPVLPPPSPNYMTLDNLEDTWINLNPFQVRPMALTADNGHIYAANTWHSTVVHFDATLQPVDIFRTLWAPVSVALYVSPIDDLDSDRLLVVCRNSNALVVHNRLTGDVIDVVSLPPEPADIVVDQDTNVAFVSTTGTDVVAEVDLITNQVTRTFAVPSRNPVFLSTTPDGEVLVAPRWSGNNSGVHRHPVTFPVDDFNTQANSQSVLDLANPAVATPPGLPDEDLFWLDRTTGTAVPVARGMGTILLAHGIQPADATGLELWQLNTEANNKDPSKQSEAAIRGIISANRLTKVTLASPLGSAVVQPAASGIIDLDDADLVTAGTQYNPALSVGTPYSLTFTSGGFALVTGLLTDNITALDPQGNRVLEWDLPAGCIPRQVLLDATETLTVTYCAGLNQVLLHSLLVNPPALAAPPLDLGFDPTPPLVREGRKIFYDGGNSLHGNHSCATCHDEGRLDLMAWNLSAGEKDNKGPMVTQTLTAINRLGRFHWRAEQLQDLLDFNPAFPNLLGGSELATGPGSAFEKFEAFVLSLENPANPFQNPSRVLDDTIHSPNVPGGVTPGRATFGQVKFKEVCEGCHHLPTGTSNDVIGDGALFDDPIPKRQWMQVAHLTDLQLKGNQPDVPVTVLGANRLYPLLGIGLAHSGNPRNLFHFVSFFGISAQEVRDITDFLFQYDLGLAPAAHSHVLLNSATLAAARPFFNNFLVPQCSAPTRNCDIGVFGRTDPGGGSRIVAWVFDRATGMFQRDDGLRQPLSFFFNQVQVSRDWFVFAGLPVGMGPGWAIDFDRDQLFNALEQNPTGGPDSDGDTWWDGHEFLNGGDPFNAAVVPNDTTNPSILNFNAQWTTAKAARLTFETSELATYSLTLTPPGGTGLPVILSSGNRFKLQHDAVISTLYPGQSYNGLLTVTDLAGLTAQTAFAIAVRGFTDLSTTTVVGDLTWTPQPDPVLPGVVHFTVKARVDFKTSGPPRTPAVNHVLVARPLVDGQTVAPANLSTGQPQAFCVNGFAYPPPFALGTTLGGPFVVSNPTDPAGATSFLFTLSGLTSGQEVFLSVEAVGLQDPATPLCPAPAIGPNLVNSGTPGGSFLRLVPTDWSFPDTPQSFRALTYVQP